MDPDQTAPTWSVVGVVGSGYTLFALYKYVLKETAEVHDIAHISMIIWEILFYSCTLINMIKERQTIVVIFIVMPSHVPKHKQSCDCPNSLKVFSCVECMSYFVLYTLLVWCHWLFLKYHIGNLLRCLLFVYQTCVLTKKLCLLPSQHQISGHYRPASETPFGWRFAGWPIARPDSTCLLGIDQITSK